MERCLCKTGELLDWLLEYTIKRVPRAENANADALVKLASSYPTELSRSVPVEILEALSLQEPEVMNAEAIVPT